MKTPPRKRAKRPRRKTMADLKQNWPVPVPLTWIESVPIDVIDADRAKGFSVSHLLFEVLLLQCAEPIRLDVRVNPYRVLDGKHRIFIARERRLVSVPALLEVPVGEGDGKLEQAFQAKRRRRKTGKANSP